MFICAVALFMNMTLPWRSHQWDLSAVPGSLFGMLVILEFGGGVGGAHFLALSAMWLSVLIFHNLHHVIEATRTD